MKCVVQAALGGNQSAFDGFHGSAIAGLPATIRDAIPSL